MNLSTTSIKRGRASRDALLSRAKLDSAEREKSFKFGRKAHVKLNPVIATFILVGTITGCVTSKPEMAKEEKLDMASFYLPNAEASRVVSVTNAGPSQAAVIVQTQRVAVKETGPKETVARFGEVYAFSPTFIAVHRDEPTLFRFWNLQPDDNHTFMLFDPDQVFMNLLLLPLEEKTYVFTFHREGLFSFVCTMHPGPMHGQILVLPPRITAPK